MTHQPEATVLVTGGCGFIGSNLIRHIIACRPGWRVVNMDSLTYAGNPANLADLQGNPNYVLVEGDIAEATDAEMVFQTYSPWALINCAAESHVDRSLDHGKDFVRTNVLGTQVLLELAHSNDCRFLQVSTDEVYGSLGDSGFFTEETPYAPNSPYAASKASSDHLIRSYFKTFGFPTITTNCSNNYGPHQFPEKLIPLMIQKAKMGEPLPIYGDGFHTRDWLYVDDHCNALEKVLEKGQLGEVYCIGGNNEKTNLSLVNTLCKILDDLIPDSSFKPHKSLIKFVKDRPGHDRRYAIDAEKIKRELGWEPTETIDTGLRKTVQWYLDNPEWIERIISGGYRGERLGLGTVIVENKND